MTTTEMINRAAPCRLRPSAPLHCACKLPKQRCGCSPRTCHLLRQQHQRQKRGREAEPTTARKSLRDPSSSSKLAPSSFIIDFNVDAVGATYIISPLVAAERPLVMQRSRRLQSGGCQMRIQHDHEEAYGPCQRRTVWHGRRSPQDEIERTCW